MTTKELSEALAERSPDFKVVVYNSQRQEFMEVTGVSANNLPYLPCVELYFGGGATYSVHEWAKKAPEALASHFRVKNEEER